MSVLFYRRPDYLNKASGPLNATECARYAERAKHSERAIPDGLSFENIVANKAMPPCSLNDFMDYLVYVEHNAENLQFYLWYQEYVRRFESLPESQKVLSPEWKPEVNEVPKLVPEQDAILKKPSQARLAKKRSASTMVKPIDHDDTMFDCLDEGSAFPMSPTPKRRHTIGPKDNESFITASTHSGQPMPNRLSGTRRSWEPFTIQPFRDEITRLTHHYFLFQSPRELNLSHRDRALVLHALQHTTHPSALAPALYIAETTLRGQAHPNFIRWSICNGNQPKIFFVRTNGVVLTVLGFLVAILLTLSGKSRWWRVFAALPWFLGIGILIAAYKGLCMILHHSHSRNLRPWEFDADPEAGYPVRNSDEVDMATSGQAEGKGDDDDRGAAVSRSSMASFGEKNEREGEWLLRYKKKSVTSKIFEKSVWTQDETLRVLQDKIVLGANSWAILLTVVLTIVFVALPKGNLY
ncbi:hypothetical protein BP6252_01205 [Coleophoma cylindrospora]|uniref:RGS domain-containing protein n=1 Tax=Coleophoma cylindrospora TaxID=1849047 RepID=A0A3D8SS76_9HELO|nr:hypothetical protein BP6252_01205 [Coleophoma cylindrospora]